MLKNIKSAACMLLLSLFFAAACSPKKEEPKTLQTGIWRATLTIQDQELPFLFEVKNNEETQQPEIYILNGEEKILLDEINYYNDSVRIGMHIFDADIVAHVTENKMTGRWVKHDTQESYIVAFQAQHGLTNRFSANPEAPAFNYEGKWEVIFTNKNGSTSKAIGIFDQNKNKLTGTFLTATGDYRYLDGQVNGDQLLLSTFDGNHAYLFRAQPVTDSTTTDSVQTKPVPQQIKGEFYSGKTGYKTWLATRNDTVELPNPDSLTYLKPGFEKISFTFPNIQGQRVSLTDEKFQGKVVILQLLGSWCPNCMDETAFLAPFYEKHREKGLEIIGLGFERSPEFEKAVARLERMKQRYDIKYELLVAGTPEKESTAKALPMLNHIMSFPTTIFIDKKGKVRKIHTGFSGPGTGKYYDDFVKDFNETVEKLLAE